MFGSSDILILKGIVKFYSQTVNNFSQQKCKSSGYCKGLFLLTSHVVLNYNFAEIQ